jgi:hypothetical protein
LFHDEHTLKMVERRKHKRFDPPSDAVVFLRTSWPDFTIVGKIIDISACGLAFLYSAASRQKDESRNLDIILAGPRFSLGKVPFKTISDFEISIECPVGFMAPRRRSVQFGDLTDNQKLALEYFIQSCTANQTEVWKMHPYSACKEHRQ